MIKRKSNLGLIESESIVINHKTPPEIKPREGCKETDVLLQDLDFLAKYYSEGWTGAALNSKLQILIVESLKHNPGNKLEALTQLSRQLHKVDQIIDKYQGDKEALIQILLDINAEYRWLPKTSLLWVSERLDIPLTQIYHIGSFYKAFSLVPQGRHIIQVCLGTACQVRGAPRLLDLVVNALKVFPPEENEQRFTLTTVNCLGCCALGPVMVIDEDHYSNPSREQVNQIIAKYK